MSAGNVVKVRFGVDLIPPTWPIDGPDMLDRSDVSASTRRASTTIDHVVYVVNDSGVAVAGVAVNLFTITIETDDGTTFATAVETAVVSEIGAGVYRLRYSPLIAGVLYRTRVRCQPDGTNDAIVTPSEFQDIPA